MSVSKSKLLIITDTTSKQTNGVVRTMRETMNILSESFDIHIISPESFKTWSLPFYPEIEIARGTKKIGNMIEEINPDYIHISTEGPVGVAGKRHCDRKGYRYSTSYHSMFPEFINKMFGVPVFLTYPYFKWFHSRSANVMVPTNQVKTLLESRGFKNIVIWKRGVNLDQFNPKYHKERRVPHSHLRYVLCVSRISKEKGLDDFCSISLPNNYLKVVVGDGPYLNHLQSKYQDVLFLGKKTGEDLAEKYGLADVFIFPSRTDTFGLTQLEAIASGTPVLAYQNTASTEIITSGVSGYLVSKFSQDTIDKAITLDRTIVAEEAKAWSWEACTKTFRTSLVTK